MGLTTVQRYCAACDINNILLKEVKEIKDLGVCFDSLLFLINTYVKKSIKLT